MKIKDYVHGYSERENLRLFDQANTLTGLLHGDTRYPAGSTVLEVGCGVGAQTVILAKNSPGARFTSIDVSRPSLRAAEDLIRREKLPNVDFRLADVFALPFGEESFDHVFVCFLLEHLTDPAGALVSLKSVLKKGGTITVIEGDHGSATFHPECPAASRAIQCLIDVQARLGGDALIGRRLFPLLRKVGFNSPVVSPRTVYADSSRPEWVEGFTRNTFTAMVEGVREQALGWNLIDEESWERGIAGLHASAEEDGVFCYTFFKGTAVR
jgi:SAM-dependent methyltransferase